MHIFTCSHTHTNNYCNCLFLHKELNICWIFDSAGNIIFNLSRSWFMLWFYYHQCSECYFINGWSMFRNIPEVIGKPVLITREKSIEQRLQNSKSATLTTASKIKHFTATQAKDTHAIWHMLRNGGEKNRSLCFPITGLSAENEGWRSTLP